jgi:hypothetical protein
VWRNQLEKAVSGDSEAAQRALAAAENTAKALWSALDGIEAARPVKAA